MSRRKKEPSGVPNIAKIWPSTISQEEWAARVREILQESDRLTAGIPSMQACADLMIWALGVLWTGLSPEVVALSCRESLVVGHPVIVAPPVEEQLQHLAERLEEPRRLAHEVGDGVVRVNVTPPVLLERASDTPEAEPAPAVDPAAEPAAEVSESAATPEGVEPDAEPPAPAEGVEPEPEPEQPAAAAEDPVAGDEDDAGEWLTHTGLRGLCPHGRKMGAAAAILKRHGGPDVVRQTESGWLFHRERSRELLANARVRRSFRGMTTEELNDHLRTQKERQTARNTMRRWERNKKRRWGVMQPPPPGVGEPLEPAELAPEEAGEQEAMAALDQLINDVRATEPSEPEPKPEQEHLEAVAEPSALEPDAEQEAPGPEPEQEDPEPAAVLSEPEPDPEPGPEPEAMAPEAEPTPEPPASPAAASAPAPAPAMPDPAVIAAVVAQVMAAMQTPAGQR